MVLTYFTLLDRPTRQRASEFFCPRVARLYTNTYEGITWRRSQHRSEWVDGYTTCRGNTMSLVKRWFAALIAAPQTDSVSYQRIDGPVRSVRSTKCITQAHSFPALELKRVFDELAAAEKTGISPEEKRKLEEQAAEKGLQALFKVRVTSLNTILGLTP